MKFKDRQNKSVVIQVRIMFIFQGRRGKVLTEKGHEGNFYGDRNMCIFTWVVVTCVCPYVYRETHTHICMFIDVIPKINAP